jgi:hypothetical protein
MATRRAEFFVLSHSERAMDRTVVGASGCSTGDSSLMFMQGTVGCFDHKAPSIPPEPRRAK